MMTGLTADMMKTCLMFHQIQRHHQLLLLLLHLGQHQGHLLQPLLLLHDLGPCYLNIFALEGMFVTEASLQ